MAIEKARAWLERFGLADEIMEFPVSSATVELAAEAVGCIPAKIAKTLSFDVDGKTVLIVAAGDAKVDNKRFKARFRQKAQMLKAEEVESRVGHAVGGVCPFGVKVGVEVYLDASLRRFAEVYPACGSSNSAIKLTLPRLEECSAAKGWIDVCKNWRPEEA